MNRTRSVTHPRGPRAIRIAIAACAISVLALTATAPALAQDPISAQYENRASQVPIDSAGPGSSAGPASGLHDTVVGGLPFTGLDLIALVAVAAAFASVGFALRRMTAANHS